MSYVEPCVEHSALVMLSFSLLPGQGVRVREHAACYWQGVLQLARVFIVGHWPQLLLSVTSQEVLSFPVAGLGPWKGPLGLFQLAP